MKDCETTITIDIKKFPREYHTGNSNPFMRVDESQLKDVENWVNRLIPGYDQTYCAEIIGRMSIPVALLMGSILGDTGCQKLTTVNPGHGMLVVWDYTRGEN
jgi:hypothetical protein